jgi:hypothetical protein
MANIKAMGIISEQISGNTISVDVKSSNLKSATYNTESKILTVTFNNGSIYEYYDVPHSLFVKFRMSESQGKFFNTSISRAFKYKKIK